MMFGLHAAAEALLTGPGLRSTQYAIMGLVVARSRAWALVLAGGQYRCPIQRTRFLRLRLDAAEGIRAEQSSTDVLQALGSSHSLCCQLRHAN